MKKKKEDYLPGAFCVSAKCGVRLRHRTIS
jgi:hypothetical protein